MITLRVAGRTLSAFFTGCTNSFNSLDFNFISLTPVLPAERSNFLKWNIFTRTIHIYTLHTCNVVSMVHWHSVHRLHISMKLLPEMSDRRFNKIRHSCSERLKCISSLRKMFFYSPKNVLKIIFLEKCIFRLKIFGSNISNNYEIRWAVTLNYHHHHHQFHFKDRFPGKPGLAGSPLLGFHCSRGEPLEIRDRFFTRQMSFLSPNQQCQSTVQF